MQKPSETGRHDNITDTVTNTAIVNFYASCVDPLTETSFNQLRGAVLSSQDICGTPRGLRFITAYKEGTLSFQCLKGQWYRLNSEKQNIVDSSCDEPVGLEVDLERQEHRLHIGVPFRIGVIAKTYDDFFEDITLVHEGQKDLLSCDDMIKGLCDALANRSEVNAVVLKIEDYGTISRLFNVLRLFRLRCPSLPLIFASSEFRGDDFGTERLPLCDASIRLPTTRASLQEAFLASQDNNAIWVARCDESQVEKSAYDDRENIPAILEPWKYLNTIAGFAPHYMPRKSRRKKLAAVYAPAP